VLKATLKEADRGRESMIKEISNSKDAQHDRIREIERHKEAEVKVLEKIIENMKAEKRDIQESYEEMICKYEMIGSKNAEEHHNTVKYFENVVSQYKQQLNKYSYP
jgi:Na+/phosphate symporter